MNTLQSTIKVLRDSLKRPSRAWTDARERRAALAQFETAAAAVDTLAEKRGDATAQHAIVRALLLERQSSSDGIWGSVLICAFAPMLMDPRRRTRFGRDEDGTQSLLTAFLAATLQVRADDYAALALQRDTDEGARSSSRRVEKPIPTVPLFEDDYPNETDPNDAAAVSAARADERWYGETTVRDGLAGDVAEIALEVGGPVLVEALTQVAYHGSLRAYVFATVPAERRASVYDRLVVAQRKVYRRLTERAARVNERSLDGRGAPVV